MPLSALLLVLLAAVCHTTWNLLLKRRTDRLAAQTTALAAAVLLASPILALYSLRDLPPQGWALALVSALFETGGASPGQDDRVIFLQERESNGPANA